MRFLRHQTIESELRTNEETSMDNGTRTDTDADLEQLLANLLDDVRDSRFLWCTTGIGFDTWVEPCEGLILGGACAPSFLNEAGGQCTLHQARILGLPGGDLDPLETWLPILESVIKNEESLLIIADEIDATVLQTLLVNVQRETLSCCVIGTGGPADITGFLASGALADQGARIVKQLPLIDRVCVRRAVSVVFSGDEQELEGSMSPVQLIHVGGADVQDQARRLEFLRCAIRDADLGQG